MERDIKICFHFIRKIFFSIKEVSKMTCINCAIFIYLFSGFNVSESIVYVLEYLKIYVSNKYQVIKIKLILNKANFKKHLKKYCNKYTYYKV